MSVVTPNLGAPWTWQEVQWGAENLPAVAVSKGGIPVWPSAGLWAAVLQPRLLVFGAGNAPG